MKYDAYVTNCSRNHSQHANTFPAVCQLWSSTQVKRRTSTDTLTRKLDHPREDVEIVELCDVARHLQST